MQINIDYFGQAYEALKTDYQVLERLETAKGDKLAVEKDGSLLITPGGFLQAPTRMVYGLINDGGYNRYAVHARLRELHIATEEFISEILTNIDQIKQDPQQKIKLKEFYKLLKHTKSTISSIGYHYRDLMGETKSSKLFSTLYSDFYNQFKHLEQHVERKTEKIKQIDEDHIPINLKKIKFNPNVRYDQSPESVEKKIEHLENQLSPLWQKVSLAALGFIAYCVVILPFGLLNGLKWTVLNPIEYCVKGEVTTESPMIWLNTNIVLYASQVIFNRNEKKAIGTYLKQLMNARIITDKHTEILCKYAKYLDRDDLRWSPGFNLTPDDPELLRKHVENVEFNLLPGAWEEFNELHEEGLLSYTYCEQSKNNRISNPPNPRNVLNILQFRNDDFRVNMSAISESNYCKVLKAFLETHSDCKNISNPFYVRGRKVPTHLHSQNIIQIFTQYGFTLHPGDQSYVRA